MMAATTSNAGSPQEHDFLVDMEEPLDFVRLNLGERIFVKMKVRREITGILQSFDRHTNMILSDVQETIIYREFDPENEEGIINKKIRKIPMLFVKGESVILISRLEN